MSDRAQRRAAIISELMRLRGTDAVEQRIQLSREALHLVDRDLWPAQWAELHRELGRDLFARGRRNPAWDPQEALAELSLAATVFNQEAYPTDWAVTRTAEGHVELFRAQRGAPEAADRAIHCYQAAWQVVNTTEQPHGLAAMQCNLGEAYRLRQSGDPAANIELALGHLDSAATGFQNVRQTEEEARARLNLALAQTERQLGDRGLNLAAARVQAKRALELTNQETDPDTWGKAHLVIGKTYQEDLAVENFREYRSRALNHFSKALRVFSESTHPLDWVSAQSGMALAYSDLGDDEKGIQHLETALRAVSRERYPERWAWAHRNLGHFYRGLTPVGGERAADHFAKALEVFDAVSQPAERRSTLSALAELHFEKGSWTQASTLMAEAIELSEKLLSRSFTEAARGEEVSATAALYGNAAYALLRLGRRSEALLCLEKGKMRLVRNRLAFAAAIAGLPPSDMRQALADAWAEFRSAEDNARHEEFAPAAACVRLSDARKALDQQIAVVRSTQPEFMCERLELNDVLNLAPRDGALVLPIVTSQGSAAFVIPHGLRSLSKSNVVRLDDLTLAEVRDLLGGRGKATGWLNSYFALQNGGPVEDWRAAIDDTSSRLWKLLMRPVHERLSLLGVKAGAPVALLPHGGLALFPLHLASRVERGRRRYFLDDYTVSYAPSASMLAFAGKLAAQAAPGSARLLAVIDPSGDLPFANAEGSAVARNLPRDDVRSLIGTAATRATVLQEAARCNYVHFACHGTFHWSNVELSSLHLADGELTLAELTGLQNQIVSRLVSLSGCDTGISQVFRRVQQNVFTSGADEYVGLPSCFLQAGVPTVVSTLWPIEDYTTSLVMGAFHARLFRTKDGVAQALRVAQRALRDLTRDEIQALLQAEQAAWKKRARVRRLRPSERELQESIAAQIAELKGCSDEHPFAHPDFWGAFITVGAG